MNSPAFRLPRALLPVVTLGVLTTAGLVAQVAPAPSADAPVRRDVPVTPGPDVRDEDVVMLSPFEVASDNKGYFAANSMSGTRFNTKVEDLATPLTVVTKEQMADFAMLDINDVFLYSVNVEGTGTYSDFVMNRNGELTDNVQLSPNTANRVRGIASANVSYGNFETTGRAPIDPIILDGVEISRGPNANVFGLGNASGTVNQVPASASTTRNRVQTEVRADSYDGFRGSIDVSRVLIKNRLGIRASAVRAREGFVRKPSGIDTVRYNAMVKFQPFRSTTLSASVLDYRAWGRRPNFTPPRDYITYWEQVGRPTWDPVTQRVHLNGQTLGPFTNDNFIATAPFDAFNRSGGQFQRSNVFVDPNAPGNFGYWTTASNNTGITPLANTGSGVNFLRLMGTSPGPGGASGRFTNQPLFSSVPSIKSKSIYDWSKYNLAAPNYTMDSTTTFMVTLDQFILNTPQQMLAAQLGFFREDSKRFTHVPVGDAGTGGQNGQYWMDVNERNLDGSPNPYFLHPYIGVNEPLTSVYPWKWDTYRVQLAYKYDFTQDKNRWTKWLGSHQFSPYYEYKYRVQRRFSFREAMADALSKPWGAYGSTGVTTGYAPANQSNSPSGTVPSSPNITREFFRFYVGDENGDNVDYAPGAIPHGEYVFNWGTTGNWRRETTQLQRIATTDNTAGTNNLKRIMKTDGAVLQSHFLGDKIVTTFGYREDEVYAKFGANPDLTPDRQDHNYAQDNHWADGDYRYSHGTTKTAQFVVRPFRDLGFLREWNQSGSPVAQFFAGLLRNATFYHNRSDNFIPSPPAIDLFRESLPNQTGTGRDTGMWLTFMDERLVIRINHYENVQKNARDGDANTIAQRVLRLDLDVTGDRHRLYARATDWWRLTNPTWSTAQVEAAVFDQMKMDRAQYDTLAEAFRSGTLAATNDIIGRGTEVEVHFNPTHYWTLVLNGEQKEALNENISSSVQRWIDLRMPVWTSVVDQNFDPTLTAGPAESTGWLATPANPNHLWWIHNYGGSQTPQQNFAVNVDSPWSIIRETEGKSRPQVRKYAFRMSTNFRLEGITARPFWKNVSLGGALRWEDKGAIGYYGVETYPAVITRLDPNRPIWDRARFYADVTTQYRTKLFRGRVGATFRFLVRNIQENGRLQKVGVFPNGQAHSYRIVDPRQFILSATFDM
jgi:hypothetical protein